MSEREAQLAAQVGAILRAAVSPLVERIAVLESRGETYLGGTKEFWDSLNENIRQLHTRLIAIETRPAPEAPEVDPALIQAKVDAAIARLMAVLPVPKDGKDGRDGTSFVAGEGIPITEAKAGDSYLDLQTGDVYRWS